MSKLTTLVRRHKQNVCETRVPSQMFRRMNAGGMGSVETNWDLHRDAHFFYALKELHAQLASDPSSEGTQVAGVHHRKCVRVTHFRVQPVRGVCGADLHDLLVQRLERAHNARCREIRTLLCLIILLRERERKKKQSDTINMMVMNYITHTHD